MAYKTIEEERAYGARPYRRAAMLVKQREYDASRRGKATRKRYQHKKRLSKEGRAYILMSAARIRAARDGWAFDLDLDWVKRKIYAGTCEVSGLPFDLRPPTRSAKNPFAPSIDRKNNDRGYTKRNCRAILWCLNVAFSDWGEQIALAASEAVLNRRRK